MADQRSGMDPISASEHLDSNHEHASNEHAGGEPTGGRAVAVKPAPQETEPAKPWLWNVVLLDDDDHTYAYVIRLLQELFHHPVERAYELAVRVDTEGRAVCGTMHRELAELRREQVMGFGRDPLVASCAGAMTAILEPAEGSDDDTDRRNDAHNNAR